MGNVEDNVRNRVAGRLANLALRLATDNYRKMLSGSIAYGLSAAARDSLAGFREERCCDAAHRDRDEFGKYSVYTCADEGEQCQTRLVGPWLP